MAIPAPPPAKENRMSDIDDKGRQAEQLALAVGAFAVLAGLFAISTPAPTTPRYKAN